MSYEQYWYGDPWMVRAYAQAYLMKRKANNEEMWLQGIYFAHALQTVIGNAFGGKKQKYLEQPLEAYPKTELEIEQEIRMERQKLIENLKMWQKVAGQRTGVDKNG